MPYTNKNKNVFSLAFKQILYLLYYPKLFFTEPRGFPWMWNLVVSDPSNGP